MEFANLISIGRAKGNSVVVDDDHVSRYHAVIRAHEDGGYVRADENRDGGELQRVVLLAVVLRLVIARQPGVGMVLAGLLPATVLVSTVPTLRPAEEVIVEGTEMTGTDAFQEAIDVEAIPRFEDPLRARLLAVSNESGEDPGRS